MTPNELVLTFGGLQFCVKFGENRQRNATVRVMTHGQTDRQTDRQTQTDFIICPIAICYSYGTDKNSKFGKMFELNFGVLDISFQCLQCPPAVVYIGIAVLLDAFIALFHSHCWL